MNCCILDCDVVDVYYKKDYYSESFTKESYLSKVVLFIYDADNFSVKKIFDFDLKIAKPNTMLDNNTIIVSGYGTLKSYNEKKGLINITHLCELIKVILESYKIVHMYCYMNNGIKSLLSIYKFFVGTEDFPNAIYDLKPKYLSFLGLNNDIKFEDLLTLYYLKLNEDDNAMQRVLLLKELMKIGRHHYSKKFYKLYKLWEALNLMVGDSFMIPYQEFFILFNRHSRSKQFDSHIKLYNKVLDNTITEL